MSEETTTAKKPSVTVRDEEIRSRFDAMLDALAGSGRMLPHVWLTRGKLLPCNVGEKIPENLVDGCIISIYVPTGLGSKKSRKEKAAHHRFVAHVKKEIDRIGPRSDTKLQKVLLRRGIRTITVQELTRSTHGTSYDVVIKKDIPIAA